LAASGLLPCSGILDGPCGSRQGYVAASVGPTGEIVEEEGGNVTADDLYQAFREQVVALEEGGADALCIETMSSLTEAVQAIRAAKDHTRLPLISTFTFQVDAGGCHAMMGVTPERTAKEAAAAGADVIGVNCGNGIAIMIDITRQMRAAQPHTPILIHANAGMPVLEGANIVGGLLWHHSRAYRRHCESRQGEERARLAE
jgi:5-methyltetrahydrofolate--homocysteine methyltransferase